MKRNGAIFRQRIVDDRCDFRRRGRKKGGWVVGSGQKVSTPRKSFGERNYERVESSRRAKIRSEIKISSPRNYLAQVRSRSTTARRTRVRKRHYVGSFLTATSDGRYTRRLSHNTTAASYSPVHTLAIRTRIGSNRGRVAFESRV